MLAEATIRFDGVSTPMPGSVQSSRGEGGGGGGMLGACLPVTLQADSTWHLPITQAFFMKESYLPPTIYQNINVQAPRSCICVFMPGK